MPDLLRALLETRLAHLADVTTEAGHDRLLLRSDLGGTMQLYELEPGEPLRAVTHLPDPVGTALYVPGGSFVVAEIDEGGDERHQLYLAELGREHEKLDGMQALTADRRFGHHLAGVSPDGGVVGYLSNRANGVDFDLWACDLSTGEHRLVYAGRSWLQPGSGFSPDGRFVSVLRPGDLPLDFELVLVDIATGELTAVLPHPGEAAEVRLPVWWGTTEIFVSSNVGQDRASVVRFDLETGESRPLTDGSFDAAPVAGIRAAAGGDGVLAVVENRNGESRVVLLDPDDASGAPVEVPLAEPGVVALSHYFPDPRLSGDGSRLYYTLSTPRLAGDVWCFDRSTGENRRLTRSPAGVEPEVLVTPEAAEVASFDGEPVPLHVYHPRPPGRPADQGPGGAADSEGRPPGGDALPPVVVLVHGGPESQAMLTFNPVLQALATAGYAVVVPNVRGSTGYGKRYASLDDTTRRLDSVRDLAAVHSFLAGAGLDSERAALWGGSYGGYMVLAGLAFQPELWAAGVDIVGISDLVTFLENTSDYRRAHREREYGSLSRDRDFLAAASPLRRAEEIRAPLFVIHGRNDPRVPLSEAEQLVATLEKGGIPCELAVYDDEGHGLARLANRLDAYPRAVDFLDGALGRRTAPR